MEEYVLSVGKEESAQLDWDAIVGGQGAMRATEDPRCIILKTLPKAIDEIKLLHPWVRCERLIPAGYEMLGDMSGLVPKKAA